MNKAIKILINARRLFFNAVLNESLAPKVQDKKVEMAPNSEMELQSLFESRRIYLMSCSHIDS